MREKNTKPEAAEATKGKTDQLSRRFSQLGEIEDVNANIDMALDILYNHFLTGFYEETQGVNEIAGMSNLCGYLESFGQLVQIAADRIRYENKHLLEIYETMWADYLKEREPAQK